MYSTDLIKELREKTGAGISDIKKALEESKGDRERALELITRKLGATAAKKVAREVKAGLVGSYIHSNGRIGSMVEILCETDFVARNPAFVELAHDIAMHIAATSPLYLSLEQIPKEVYQAEKAHVAEETAGMNKPAQIMEQIIEGKLNAHFSSLALLSQPFVKDQDKTVGEYVNETIGKFGENIKIGKFIRFEV